MWGSSTINWWARGGTATSRCPPLEIGARNGDPGPTLWAHTFTRVWYLLSRCHDMRTAELLIMHGKVTSPDIRRFLASEETVECLHCQAWGDFYGGYGDDGEWWSAADWLWWHINSEHGKWMQLTALAHQVALVARESGSRPLTFE